MGKFKEFLKTYKMNESVEITEADFELKGQNGENGKREEEVRRINDIIDNDPELQKAIDELNAEENPDALEESELTEGNYVPFGFDGTFYNGDEKVDMVAEEMQFQDKGEELLEDDENGEGEVEKKNTTASFKFLEWLKDNPQTLAQVRDNLQTIRMKDGKLQRRGNMFYGDYKDMTEDEIRKMVDFVNEKMVLKKTVYSIDNNGVLSKKIVKDENGNEVVVKPQVEMTSPSSMKRICNILNELYRETMPDRLLWWQDKEGSKKKVIAISKDDVRKSASNDQIHDFSGVEYEPVRDKALQDDICFKLFTAMNRKSSKSKEKVGYENGRLTLGGKPMTEEQQKVFIRERSGIADANDGYWEKFNFLAEGSKIGTSVGSFSLPPGASCIKGVPCAHQGCYAYPSFKYPTVRACWMSNLAKLQEGDSEGKDRFKQFEDECKDFINRHHLKFFRFHVSGDVDIGNNKDRYIQAICNIARDTGGVKFWTYTKDYGAWANAEIPGNLVVLMSAWGKFQPNDSIKKDNPVAFLYDENDKNVQRYLPEGFNPAHFNEYEANDRKAEVVFCPCSDPAIKETVTCERCGICYTRKEVREDGSVVKVGNVAFHKH